eukprot:2253462-Pyramimonas_sp.AAC.2
MDWGAAEADEVCAVVEEGMGSPSWGSLAVKFEALVLDQRLKPGARGLGCGLRPVGLPAPGTPGPVGSGIAVELGAGNRAMRKLKLPLLPSETPLCGSRDAPFLA